MNQDLGVFECTGVNPIAAPGGDKLAHVSFTRKASAGQHFPASINMQMPLADAAQMLTKSIRVTVSEVE